MGINPLITFTLLGFLVYGKTLFYDFTYLDDHLLILENFSFLQNLGNILPALLKDVFYSPVNQAYYRPLLTISFILDAQLSGTNPFFYHLTNLLIHITVTLLLHKLLTRHSHRASILPFFLSLIFLVHPVLSQAVAWIPGRNDSLLAIFIIGSFLFFLRYLEDLSPKSLLGHLGLFTLALFTKESALLLPLLLILYLFIVFRKKLDISKIQYLILGWVAPVITWFFLRKLAFTDPISYSLPAYIQSLINHSPAIIQLLGKVFFPFNLSVLPIIEDTTFSYGIVATVLVIILVLFSLARKSPSSNFIVFGLFWFLAFLLPSFIRPNPNIVADFLEHRLYLPIIGLFLVLTQGHIPNKTASRLTLSVIIVGFSLLNFIHTPVFKDRLSFWQNAAQFSPHHPLAHRNLGVMYYFVGDIEQASTEYKRSLELNPEEPMAHNNLGLIYLDKKMYQESENEFLQELEVNPLYDRAHFNLGMLYYQTGQTDKAAQYWEKTLQLNPDYKQATQNLLFLQKESSLP